METFFYEAFNEPHVRLVDLLETPIEEINSRGLRTSKEDFQFDMLIYATGFSASESRSCFRERWPADLSSHWSIRCDRLSGSQ